MPDLGELMSDGLAAPLGEVIAAVGRGVAEAQAALDQASLSQTLAVYGAEGDAGLSLLREIGYRPTFYVLPETVCEVQVSLRVGGSGGPDGSAGGPVELGKAIRAARTYVTPVDAGFASRYAYQAQGAAKLTFKILPVPPPAALEEGRPMPDLVGRSAESALSALSALGLSALTVDPSGEAIPADQRAGQTVTAQDTAPLRLVSVGGSVTLTLER